MRAGVLRLSTRNSHTLLEITMLHKFLLTILIGQIAFLGLSNFVPLVSAAQINTDYLFGGNVTNVQKLSEQSGLDLQDPRETVAKVVNVILGFLGIIAVVLILIAGFLWMTAAGSEEKISTAKKLMSAGVIGLVIVLAAFGIARFVISSMLSATGGDSGGDVTTEGLRDSGTGGQESRTAADMPSDEQSSGNRSLPMSNNTDSAGQALNGGNNVIRIDAEEVIE